MKYKIKVKVETTLTLAGRRSKIINLDCIFNYDENGKGNGFFAYIGNREHHIDVDLRYDATFKPDNKEKWLEEWAKSYFNSKMYRLKSLEIKKVQGLCPLY